VNKPHVKWGNNKCRGGGWGIARITHQETRLCAAILDERGGRDFRISTWVCMWRNSLCIKRSLWTRIISRSNKSGKWESLMTSLQLHWFLFVTRVSHRKCLREQKYILRAIHDAGLEYPYHSLVTAVLRPSHGVLPVELCGLLLTGPGITVHFLIAHAFKEEEKAGPSDVFERYREVDGSGQSCW